MSKMHLSHQTLIDPTLDHQVIFYHKGNTTLVQVSCNCLAYQRQGGLAHHPMGATDSLEESRELYNNPENHIKPFREEDKAKW